MPTSIATSERGYSDGAYMLERDASKRLVGRLYTLIESMGLKEKQEKAMKDIFSQEVWSVFNDFGDPLFLPPSFHLKVLNYNSQKERERMSLSSGRPPEGESDYPLDGAKVVDTK